MTTEPLAAGLQERLSDHRFRSGAYWVLSQLALCYPLTGLFVPLFPKPQSARTALRGKPESSSREAIARRSMRRSLANENFWALV
jgi:hypothetical protein